ncbi:MAG: DUF2147 domain-containing protein [Bacteroidota bacterium]
MKNVLLTSLYLLIYSPGADSDQIQGYWLTGEGKTIVEIYEDAANHNGKIVWLEKPNNRKGEPHTDKMNPDRSLRNRPIMGLNMLENLEYKDGQWHGKLYVPKKGRTVDAVLSLVNNDELQITVSLRGFTKEISWYRTQAPE